MGDPFELGAFHSIIRSLAITEVVGAAGTAGMKAHKRVIMFESVEFP